MTLYGQRVAEQRLPAQADTGAGVGRQPAVVKAAALPQTEALFVTAQSGYEDQLCRLGGDEGTAAVGLHDPMGAGQQIFPGNEQPELHLPLGQGAGECHPLALGNELLRQTSGIGLPPPNPPKGKNRLGLFHLGQSQKAGEQSVVTGPELLGSHGGKSAADLLAEAGFRILHRQTDARTSLALRGPASCSTKLNPKSKAAPGPRAVMRWSSATSQVSFQEHWSAKGLSMPG